MTKKTSKMPGFQPPMLATLTDKAFVSKEWVFEPKLDGIRGLSYIDKGNAEIFSRRGLQIDMRYPALKKDLAAIKGPVILDGEIIALDSNNRPSFQKLQERSGLTKIKDILEAETKNPIIYYVFDILFLRGQDLRHLTLVERKKILQQTVRSGKYVRIIEELGSNGEKAFAACIKNGLEGVVGKRLESSYQSNRRSADWLKVKGTQSAEFLICGYTQGTGARRHTFGALILGEHDRSGTIIYISNVGTGFNDKQLVMLYKKMAALKTNICPFKSKPRGLGQAVWLQPQLVAEIKFAERTKDNSLRVPVFMHLREDIEPAKVSAPKIVKVTKSKVRSKIKG